MPGRAELHPMLTWWHKGPVHCTGVHVGSPPLPALASSVWPAPLAQRSRWLVHEPVAGWEGLQAGEWLQKRGVKEKSGSLLDDVAVIVLKGHGVEEAFVTG